MWVLRLPVACVSLSHSGWARAESLLHCGVRFIVMLTGAWLLVRRYVRS